MSTETNPKRRFYIKIQVKLGIAFTLIFMIVFAAIFYWFYNYATGVAKTRIGAALTNELVAGAAKVNGTELLALYNEATPSLYSDRGDTNSSNDVYYTTDPRYWDIAEWLHTIRTLDPNAQPWTFIRADIKTDPEGFFYVVDGLALDNPLPNNTVDFKSHDTATDGKLFTGLDKTAVYLNDIYEWQGQWYVSGYTPIKDSNGKVVAGLGIDYVAQYIIDVETQIRNLAIPAFVITFVIAFLLVYGISRILSRPIVTLTRIAEHIGEGDYEQDFSPIQNIPIHDEINTLADVFQIMINKVARREERLKQQVADLQIQIDHSKRDEQVKEIVDNDFFQTLQSKAFEMRTRRRQQETEESE